MKLEKKEYGVIYKIENKINGKIYIGQTTRNFKKRYKSNLFKNTHNEHLKRSILKYGENSFNITERFDVAYSQEELNKKEEYYIEKYNCCDIKYGYNKKSGGNNAKMSNSTILKQIASHGHPVYCLTNKEGYISASEAEKVYNKRIGEALRKFKKYQILYHGKVLVFVNPLQYYRSSYNRGVVCITNNKYYNSIKQAERELNITRGLLSLYLDNKNSKYIKNKFGEHFIIKECRDFYKNPNLCDDLKDINKLYTAHVNILCIETGIIYKNAENINHKLKLTSSKVHYSCLNNKPVRIPKTKTYLTFKYI